MTKLGLDKIKDAVVDDATAREAGITFAAVSAVANDYIRGNVTFSYLVERLRELALDAAEKIATQRHDDHIMDVQHAHEEGIAEGERRATERIVVWLRASVSPGFADDVWDAVRWRADEIEDGRYRHEEKP